MKITHVAEKINLNQIMDISVDVHKDTLNSFLLLIAGNTLIYATIGQMSFKDE